MLTDGMCLVCLFFFFKQKTAYEMRISDWSSDVCSSDLQHDTDQRHQLPIESLARETEGDGRGEEIGGRDRQRDQGHHTGLLLAQLGDEAGEERPAAIDIDDGGEREEHKPIAGTGDSLGEAQPMLDRTSTRLNSSH